MKYLFINTAIQGQINLAIFDEQKKLNADFTNVEYEYSKKLLSEIDTLLKSLKITVKDISGIIAVHGPGRFSALRVGVTTANTLAWSNNIPVLGIPLDESDDTNIINHIQTLRESKEFTQPVVPQYGQEPNISKPKS